MSRSRSFLLTSLDKALRGRGMLLGLLFLGTFGLSLLTGCGIGDVASSAGTNSQGVALQGMVHGGQQPVVGAQVYLYAAGTTGYASAPKSLLNGSGFVTTGPGGSFTITDDYTCEAAPADQVFLLATGGNPGNPAGSPNGGVNPQIVLMAALGSCADLKANAANEFIVVNEATTVASAYALAPFMSYPNDGSDSPIPGGATGGAIPQIGAPAPSATCTTTTAATCNYTGLAHAFATASNLVNLASGQAYSVTPAYAGNVSAVNASYVPQARINSLANALAACVNSTGGTAGDGNGGTDSPCGTLFDNTTPNATSVPPSDTLQAILNLAQAQGPSATITGNLYQLSLTGLVPFTPALTSVPNDWSLALGFTAGGFGKLTGPGSTTATGLAIDATGNIWATSGSNGGVSTGFLAEFNNLGAPISPNTTATTLGGYQAGSINAPLSIAIDQSGFVWVGNSNSSLSVLTQSGTQELAPVTGGGLGATVTGIAIDKTAHVWTVGSSAGAQFNSDGTAVSTSKYNPGNDYFASMGRAAFDSLGVNLFAVDFTTAAVIQSKTSTPTALTKAWYPNQGIYDVAGDSLGNVFSLGNQGSVLKLNPTAGTVTSTFTYNSVQSAAGQALALDGASNIWVVGYHVSGNTPYLHELSKTGQRLSPATTGFTGGGGGGDLSLLQNIEAGVAVDGSGNVWVLNPSNFYSMNQYQLVEFVGLGEPVVTPTSVALKNGEFATLP